MENKIEKSIWKKHRMDALVDAQKLTHFSCFGVYQGTCSVFHRFDFFLGEGGRGLVAQRQINKMNYHKILQ